ncbi:MAG: DNA translocase FtsK, partial [Pseudomonadota bacterium]
GGGGARPEEAKRSDRADASKSAPAVIIAAVGDIAWANQIQAALRVASQDAPEDIAARRPATQLAPQPPSLDNPDMRAGAEAAIQGAAAVVLILTDRALSERWVRFAAETARRSGAPLIPILFDPIAPEPLLTLTGGAEPIHVERPEPDEEARSAEAEPAFGPTQATALLMRLDALAETRAETQAAESNASAQIEATDTAQASPAEAAALSDDALYAQAVEIVVGEGKASTSFLQRRLEIDWARAARLIDRMERDGVVSAADDMGRRSVLAASVVDARATAPLEAHADQEAAAREAEAETEIEAEQEEGGEAEALGALDVEDGATGPEDPPASAAAPPSMPAPAPGAVFSRRRAGPFDEATTDIAPSAPADAAPPRPKPSTGDATPAAGVAAAKLFENLPRRMRVGLPQEVVVRIGRTEKAGEGMPSRERVTAHDIVAASAMTVTLDDPSFGYAIRRLTPATQWVDREALAALGMGLERMPAEWRWSVEPLKTGVRPLVIRATARVSGADGVSADAALPEQAVEVRVGVNPKRLAGDAFRWALIALAAGVIGHYAGEIAATAQAFLQ